MTQNLVVGRVASCGQGQCHPNAKHGQRKTPEYAAWVCMKQRCLNGKCRNFELWGGRGVKIHPPWINDFSKFLDYVGKRPSKNHSLDRIDTDGHYEPGNVRWALPAIQQGNKRHIGLITFKGKTQASSKWSIELCGNKNMVRLRLRAGWSIEKALTTPPRKW